VQAHIHFQQHKRDPTTAQFEIFEVKIGCSQRVLDQVVQSIYTKHIKIDRDTAEEIFLLGDYLQVMI